MPIILQTGFLFKHLDKFLYQRLASPGFHFQDRDCQNPSINVNAETDTMILTVSVNSPRLGI